MRLCKKRKKIVGLLDSFNKKVYLDINEFFFYVEVFCPSSCIKKYSVANKNHSSKLYCFDRI
jgi:hypothetical protein